MERVKLPERGVPCVDTEAHGQGRRELGGPATAVSPPAQAQAKDQATAPEAPRQGYAASCYGYTLTYDGGGRGSWSSVRRSDCGLEGLAIQTASACAGVPARTGGVTFNPAETVIGRAGWTDNASKGRLRQVVESRIQVSDRKSIIGVDPGDQASIQRRDRASPADRLGP